MLQWPFQLINADELRDLTCVLGVGVRSFPSLLALANVAFVFYLDAELLATMRGGEPTHSQD